MSVDPPALIVVCDNNSADSSVQELSKAFADIEQRRFSIIADAEWEDYAPADQTRGELVLVLIRKNCGYAGGNNIGLKIALNNRFEYVWVLNNDTVVDSMAATNLLAYMARHMECGLCGTLTRYMDDPEVVQCYGGGVYNRWLGLSRLCGEGERLALCARPSPLALELDYVNGASVFVRREFLQSVGLLDERYFLYCEEMDWGYRAKGKYVLGYESDAVVFHHEGLATGASNQRGFRRSIRASAMLVRSRLLLTAKFFPWLLPTVIIGQGYALLRKACRYLGARG